MHLCMCSSALVGKAPGAFTHALSDLVFDGGEESFARADTEDGPGLGCGVADGETSCVHV